MANAKRFQYLIMLGRVRILSLDMSAGVCMVRVVAPAGGAPLWPSNVVALKRISYTVASSIRGLINAG